MRCVPELYMHAHNSCHSTTLFNSTYKQIHISMKYSLSFGLQSYHIAFYLCLSCSGMRSHFIIARTSLDTWTDLQHQSLIYMGECFQQTGAYSRSQWPGNLGPLVCTYRWFKSCSEHRYVCFCIVDLFFCNGRGLAFDQTAIRGGFALLSEGLTVSGFILHRYRLEGVFCDG
jgi:hypothetical protein